MYSASQVYFKRDSCMIIDVFLNVRVAGNQVTLYVITELDSIEGVVRISVMDISMMVT